ncbi:hypothetical protein LCGC14_0176380 [marine sediment metagenome]|uniref:Uncharacterized protein n=1 Tax=marine sediment metagenome TaxID=412755 RepID=A0A0F9UVP0_9ZZZZ
MNKKIDFFFYGKYFILLFALLGTAFLIFFWTPPLPPVEPKDLVESYIVDGNVRIHFLWENGYSNSSLALIFSITNLTIGEYYSFSFDLVNNLNISNIHIVIDTFFIIYRYKDFEENKFVFFIQTIQNRTAFYFYFQEIMIVK